jgi:hypothetical protein
MENGVVVVGGGDGDAVVVVVVVSEVDDSVSLRVVEHNSTADLLVAVLAVVVVVPNTVGVKENAAVVHLRRLPLHTNNNSIMMHDDVNDLIGVFGVVLSKEEKNCQRVSIQKTIGTRRDFNSRRE